MAFWNKHNGARAFGAFALLLCTVGQPVTAQQTIILQTETQTPPQLDEDFTAVYLARVVEMTHVGFPPCPPEVICWNAIWDIVLDPVDMLGSDQEVGRQTYRISQHAAYLPGSTLVAAVQRDVDGKWHLISRSHIEKRVCFHDPNGDIWDNHEDPDREWDAEHDRETRQTCLTADAG